jgi:hypothetical protein
VPLSFQKREREEGTRCTVDVIFGGKFCWQHKGRYDESMLNIDSTVAVSALEKQVKVMKRELARIRTQADECKKSIENLENPPNNKDEMLKSLQDIGELKIE